MKTECVVLKGINKVELEYLEVPKLQPGQVLVKIHYAGLCGSQINEIKGRHKEFIPHLLGHEGCGVVVDIGKGITEVKEGDEVIITWLKGSGLNGGSKKYGDCNAGSVTTFQKYSIISESNLVKYPLHKDNLALFGCMVPTGWGTVYNVMPHIGSVKIFGVGNVGSICVLAAKSLGMNVSAIDVSADKLIYASELGADNTSFIWNDIYNTDTSIDTTGKAEVIEKAFSTSNLVVVVGNSYKSEKVLLDPFDFIRGKRMVGSWGGDCNATIIPWLVDNFDVSKVRTKVYSMYNIEQAIEDFTGCAKILLEC